MIQPSINWQREIAASTRKQDSIKRFDAGTLTSCRCKRMLSKDYIFIIRGETVADIVRERKITCEIEQSLRSLAVVAGLSIDKGGLMNTVKSQIKDIIFAALIYG